MKLSYPSINVKTNGNVFISFVIGDKRIRLSSGKKIGVDINPNSYPPNERYNIAKILCSEVYNYLMNGGTLNGDLPKNLPEIDYLKEALKSKLKENVSKDYKRTLAYVFREVEVQYKTSKNLSKSIKLFLEKFSHNTSYNTIKKHLSVLVNKAMEMGLGNNPMKDVKSKKSKQILHKPFKNIRGILNEIESYSDKLHLCALLTYGCLLRPHREIRELTWGDFNSDMTQINLSGSRNKSGRNRIVPVPNFISDKLVRGEDSHNIFTNTINPPNQDYFKTLWSRFKKVSNMLEDNQTLYSFRHSGAVDIFTRTKDLSKLQSVMGHASLSTSLIYLRGLEVTQLTLEDMPSL